MSSQTVFQVELLYDSVVLHLPVRIDIIWYLTKKPVTAAASNCLVKCIRKEKCSLLLLFHCGFHSDS